MGARVSASVSAPTAARRRETQPPAPGGDIAVDTGNAQEAYQNWLRLCRGTIHSKIADICPYQVGDYVRQAGPEVPFPPPGSHRHQGRSRW